MAVVRLIFGLLYFTLVSTYEETQLHYECDPEGIIYVENPAPDVYVWARAYTPDYICHTVVGQDPNTITIYNCFDRDLTLLLNDEMKWPMILKQINKSYKLSCKAIPEEGIVKKVVDESLVTVRAPTAAAPPRYPTIPLESTLVDPETGEVKIMAVIGEPFDWVIRAPVGYKTKPLDCTSSGGENSIYSLDTHVAGCTIDSSLMSDFKFVDETQTSVVTTVHTFRFPDSNQLMLSCNMLACLNTSDSCDFNCSRERRRRSDEKTNSFTEKVDYSAQKYTVSTIYPSVSSKRRRRETSDRQASVGASITVIGEPNIFVPGYCRGSSPTLYCSSGSLLMLTSLAYFFLYLFLMTTEITPPWTLT